MTCTWCKETATLGGKVPDRVSGPQYLLSCDRHKPVLEHLKYEPTALTEIERALRLEAKQKK